jgi:hypothetical protein
MNLESLPAELSSLYLGLGNLDVRALLPTAYQDYVDYLNPANHNYSVNRGRIDIGFDDTNTSLSFNLQDLSASYVIPAYNEIPESSADVSLSAMLRLKGSYNAVNKKGTYNSASLEGVISGEISFLGQPLSLNEFFSTQSVGLSIDIDGDITIGSKDRWRLDLSSIAVTYSNGFSSLTTATTGRFKASRKGVSLDVDGVSFAYQDAVQSWQANVNILDNGQYNASIFRNSALVGRINGDSRSSLSVELSADLLAEFNINDASLNALLTGQTLEFSDQQVSEITATLGQSGSDLSPSIAFDRNGTDESYALETVLQQLLGFQSVDLRLLNTAPIGGGGGGGGGGASSSAPSAPAGQAPPVTPATPAPGKPEAAGETADSLLGVLPQQAVTKLTLPKPLDIDGRLFNQAVVGTGRSDRISGSSDDEILAGGVGRDRLSGKAGADAFLFEVAEFGKRKADTITDFNRRQGDQIAISAEAFAGLNQLKLTNVAGKGALKDGATSGNPFIYDASNGRLYYDANGSKPGLGDGGLFAILQGAPALRAGDLALV